MSDERALVSLGRASALLQTMPHRITNAAQALSIEPAMRLNEISYFRECDLEKVANYLRQSAATTTTKDAKQC